MAPLSLSDSDAMGCYPEPWLEVAVLAGKVGSKATPDGTVYLADLAWNGSKEQRLDLRR